MADEVFRRSVRIARPAEAVFAWHERTGAFARLVPPWERVEVTRHVGGIRDGARVSLRTRLGPFWANWEIVHRDYLAGRQFRDVLISGPFAKWEHLHRIEPDGPAACVLTDEIHYRLPLGVPGRWCGAGFARSQLARMFEYRHAVTKADLENAATGAPKCVLISGGSGLVGRALQGLLETQGHTVRTLVRRAARNEREFEWEPAAGTIDATALAGVDAVIHLAGANVGVGRWTAARKTAIRSSRVDGTRTLAKGIAARPPGSRPEVFVSASAVGVYGSREDAQVGEDAGLGAGFLAEVCAAWEGELAAVEALGVRTVALRTGVVLSPAGGALAKMLPAFLAGAGGRLGSGRQWMSWITPDDLGAMYLRAVVDSTWRGAFNAVAPAAVTNAEFTATLARVLRRPAILPVPAAGLKLIFGEMAEETLLASTRAVPTRAIQAGFVWRHSELEPALRHVLGRKGRTHDE